MYDEVWTIAGNFLKQSSKLQQPRFRWWERKDWEDKIGDTYLYKPFVLKAVNKKFACATCHPLLGCSGCIIKPEDPPDFMELRENTILVCEWHSETLNDNYNPLANEVVDHSSVNLE